MSALPTSGGAVVSLPRIAESATRLLGRDIGFAALAVVVIVASADVRIPVGLPGHRGVLWLASLVAITLMTRYRASVIAAGAASTVLTQAPHLSLAIGPSGRYVAAAALLYAASTVPGIGRRGWFLALAAAPIHVVALLRSGAAGSGRSHFVAPFTPGLTEKAMFHLGFGLIAGLIGWAVASGVNRALPIASQRASQRSGGLERVSWFCESSPKGSRRRVPPSKPSPPSWRPRMPRRPRRSRQ